VDRKILIERKAQLEKQRDAELKGCRAKWRRKLDAIDLLLRESGHSNDDTQAEAQAVAFADVLEDTVEQTTGVVEAIRRTLENVSGIFTTRTLVEVINKTGQFSVTEREVANPLWRMHQAGEISILEKGSGRRPNVYLKI
jgi:hypothetical protein